MLKKLCLLLHSMTDEFYIKRCLELAELGLGHVSPNPMVGCVIVLNDEIIAEGYHKAYGEAHAEPNAINVALQKFGTEAIEILKRATVYVSLEPCAHYGKTPPCADLLVKHQVKKVVIGHTDPFAGVNGKGILKLKEAGIEVITDVLKEECYNLNKRFFTRVIKQRPYIILKWAETQNGYFGSLENKQQWITGTLAKKMAHKWRTEEDAILIGKQTALIDNPNLTSRDWPGKNPIRLVIDKNLDIPTDFNIYDTEAKTFIFNEVKTDVEGNIHYIQMEDMNFYLPQKIAFQLYLMDIQSVIIEGGANILNQFINANLWDEARVFKASQSWDNGIAAPKINGEITAQTTLNDDLLTIYSNQNN
jgi:diaminohydroxyphosphoribosylaminopyrimidine deaminase/5-amino-6-(5-phosphoribosylamino)uracil reductase